VVEISTARLRLRPMTLDDAPALHPFFSDAEAMRYWSEPHARFSDTEAWVKTTVESPSEITREFSIWHNGDVIGKAGIWKRPELGYFLRRDHWGQGLMSEALTALIPHLFDALDLETMTADVTPENHASCRLLLKHGFQQIRLVKEDHWDGQKWCDTAYFERKRLAEPRNNGARGA